MKKAFFTLVAIFALAFASFAQTPKGFNYQMVVRNSAGLLMTNRTVKVEVSILQGSETGTIVYSKTASYYTNANGLVTLVVGDDSDDYDAINWANGPYFLQSRVDPNNGQDFYLNTVQQILAVPYANYADVAATISGDFTYDEKDPKFTGWGYLFDSLRNVPNFLTAHQDLLLTLEGDTNLCIHGANGTSCVILPAGGGNTHVDVHGDTIIINNDTIVLPSANPNLAEVLAQGNDGGARQIKNILDPTDQQDAATKKYVDDAIADAIDTVSGTVVPTLGQVLNRDNNGGGKQIKNIADPTHAQDAVTLKYFQDNLSDPINQALDTVTLDKVLNNGNNGGGKQIKNIADPTQAQDAVTLKYFQDNLSAPINQALDTVTLAKVLHNGNTGDGQQIKNIADPTDTQDAVTKGYLDNAIDDVLDSMANMTIPAPGLPEVLDANSNAGNRQIHGLANPTSNQDAATKKYVDDALAGVNSTVSNLGLSHVIAVNNNANQSKIINLADPTNAQDAVNKRSMESAINGAVGNIGLSQVIAVNNNANNSKITNLADPTMPLDATNKQYVDNAIAGVNGRIDNLGNTVNNLGLSDVINNDNNANYHTIINLNTPINANDAANKYYVDITVQDAVNALNNAITLSTVLQNGNNAGDRQIKNLADPTDPKDAVNKQSLDAAINQVNYDMNNLTLNDILVNGNDAGGQTIVNLGTPTQNDAAVTKEYVDNLISGLTLGDIINNDNSANYQTIVNIASPINNYDAVNKIYVDSSITILNTTINTQIDGLRDTVIMLRDQINNLRDSLNQAINNAAHPRLDGELPGVFQVSANGTKVRFSKGNLQYSAKRNLWRFADNQWEVLGSANNNIIYAQENQYFIDLFGFGTSGWYSFADCYQGWQCSSDNTKYFAMYATNKSLVGENCNADWGVYNSIINGGNQTGTWRTLTSDEWIYLLNNHTKMRSTVSGVTGWVILPDNWEGSNTINSNYNVSQWSQMESNGAIFIPVSGKREGQTINGSATNHAYYWSTTASTSTQAKAFHGNGQTSATSVEDVNASTGCAVRLVKTY